MSTKLHYLSTTAAEKLMGDVEKNINRYLKGQFADLAKEEGWSIATTVDVDLQPFKRLKMGGSPKEEIQNALLVWQALEQLTPALASEGRIWTRLSHLEGLAYARARWLEGEPRSSVPKAVRKHFFGDTRTKRRDDNAIGRLWWAAYIARLAMPEDQHGALKIILKSTDMRSNIVERARSSSRPSIAAGVVRAVMREPGVTENEDAFRGFMKALNRLGGGVIFEAMAESEIDRFMDECYRASKKPAKTNKQAPVTNRKVGKSTGQSGRLFD
jgi:hypothetical protein